MIVQSFVAQAVVAQSNELPRVAKRRTGAAGGAFCRALSTPCALQMRSFARPDARVQPGAALHINVSLGLGRCLSALWWAQRGVGRFTPRRHPAKCRSCAQLANGDGAATLETTAAVFSHPILGPRRAHLRASSSACIGAQHGCGT